MNIIRAFVLPLCLAAASAGAQEPVLHVYGPGGPAPEKQWTEQRDIDAWLIWNIWQVANPELAQVVPLEKELRIYRDAGIVLTRRGKEDAAAKSFVEFVKSSEGQRIFAKWGWITAKR